MTAEPIRRRTPAAQVLAPTAREIVPSTPPAAPPPSEPAAVAPVAADPGPGAPDLPPAAPAASPAPTPAAAPAAPPAAAPPPSAPAPARPPARAPAPPSETEDLHSRIMSLARTTERCARVLSGLAKRVDGIEARLSASGAADPAAPSAELALMSDQIGRLAAEVAETHQRVNERSGTIELLQSELGSLSSDVGAVHDKLSELARTQRAQRAHDRPSPALQSVQRSVDDLRREVATVGSRLVGLDSRLDELQSLPAVMEEVAATQFQRLVAEMLSLPEDLEGVYRELETIAERMAAREDVAARALERVASVEAAVSSLRIDVDRVLGGLAAARQAEQEASEWRRSLERRLCALESPGAEIERLYLALDSMVGKRGTELPRPNGPGPGEDFANGAGEETVDRSEGLPADPRHARRAVEALTAELDRIRQSIDVLVGPEDHPAPPAPTGRSR